MVFAFNADDLYPHKALFPEPWAEFLNAMYQLVLEMTFSHYIHTGLAASVL